MRKKEVWLEVYAMHIDNGFEHEVAASCAEDVCKRLFPQRPPSTFASKTAEDAARSERDYVLASFPAGDQ